MEPVAVIAFAFVAGATPCGLAGSLLELVANRQLSFAEPFVSRRHVIRSIFTVLAAGPFMFGNDAIRAWRDGDISALALLSCGATAMIWILALGVAGVGLAWGAVSLIP